MKTNSKSKERTLTIAMEKYMTITVPSDLDGHDEKSVMRAAKAIFVEEIEKSIRNNSIKKDISIKLY